MEVKTYLSLLSFQMHPLGLCNNNDEEDLYEYGWVGVVKLEQPELDPSCLTVLGKVRPGWSCGATLVLLVSVDDDQNINRPPHSLLHIC